MSPASVTAHHPPARTGTHAVAVKVVPSAACAAAYVEPAADRLQPPAHARSRPLSGAAAPRAARLGSCGTLRDLDPQVATILAPVPLDLDRPVAAAVLDARW